MTRACISFTSNSEKNKHGDSVLKTKTNKQPEKPTKKKKNNNETKQKTKPTVTPTKPSCTSAGCVYLKCKTSGRLHAGWGKEMAC